jgi:hypothetical protein
MSRTQFELLNIEDTSELIKEEFKYLTLLDIRTAIRNGTSGKYGRSYKLSTQEVCFWIREYDKSKNNRNLGI